MYNESPKVEQLYSPKAVQKMWTEKLCTPVTTILIMRLVVYVILMGKNKKNGNNLKILISLKCNDI